MYSQKPYPFLPLELIHYIIDFIPLAGDKAKIAYEPSHSITKTLLALTRTSRTIYPAARKLLYTHCLYIDSPWRIQRLLISLLAYIDDPGGSHPLPSLESEPSAIQHETSLYLSPFPEDTIDDFSTAQAVYGLLTILAPTLHRLVIDIPLRSLYPEDDGLGIRRILRDGFAQLTSLEMFCSARDELFLNCSAEWPIDRSEENVWSLWPNLKTLALYNCDLDSEKFWRDIGKMKKLETLVLTRADSMRDFDFKTEWNRGGNQHQSLTVWFVDVDGGHGIPETVEEPKEGDKVRIKVECVPTSYYGDEDVIELCQDWVKRSVLREWSVF
ncbi:hypothetical protein NA56DRAFT_265684 [Hyaloscypha hepaticicola]|uniref:Uncharacterized protein n=1 Tax=Hyaloscypha hepaticicola TaxID=2082293 RepID=A0A2J6PUR0_9HELO|nr:hypothetical protein NA56DRAFT_265684 [Hyaloscypha hepaticicola]